MYTDKSLETVEEENLDEVDYIELGQAGKMALLGLSTIQIVRLQCIEY